MRHEKSMKKSIQCSYWNAFVILVKADFHQPISHKCKQIIRADVVIYWCLSFETQQLFTVSAYGEYS